MAKFTRRLFLAGAAAVSAIGNVPAFAGIDAPPDGPIVLEDDRVRAVLNRHSGSLLAFENKETAWRMQDRSQFGAGFRMYVPLPERRGHFFTEKDNPLQSVEMHPGNRGVTLVWSKLRSPFTTALDITLRANISLSGSGLLVTTEVENKSSHMIESLGYPILGDISLPHSDNVLSQGVWGYAGMNKTQLIPNFVNQTGGGADIPMEAALSAGASPAAEFLLIFTKSEGLYIGYHDVKAETMVRYQFELAPGYADSLDGTLNDITLTRDFSHIKLEVYQFVFAGPDQRKKSPPIVIRPYKGSWHAGADIYREWRKTWFTPPVSPAWVEDVHSWQQVQINSAEDSLSFPYSKLAEYGSDCARHGVKAIQLTGWNRGGQDRGNPSHDTDPRLGTAEDLRQAIEACRQMGVEVILFNKYAWSDSSTEWYRKELYRYAARNPYGEIYRFEGYPYDTPTQLAGMNTRHLVSMCTACPAWREIAFKEFHKSVELKAGGILQDELVWHGPGAYYCFSKEHGHPVPVFQFSGDAPLAEGFRKQIDPEHFLMSGEAPWDLQNRFYRLGYTRIGPDHVALQRYIDPHLPIMIAVGGWDDRQMMNRALQYRYIMSYESYLFRGRLDDFPLTIEYGKKVDTLRRRYNAYLWDGEFRDTLGATVTVGGRPHSQYSVFVNASTGQRALVIVNPSNADEMLFDVSLPNPRRLSVVTPEMPEPKDFTGQLRIPAESAAALLELQG